VRTQTNAPVDKNSPFFEVMPTLVELTSLFLDIILNFKDFAYLYSLFDEDTLWLFPYFVLNLQGIALPDTGSTRNYISRAFAL